MARTLGRGMRQIRDATSEIKTEIKKSADKIGEESGLNSVKNITRIGGNDEADAKSGNKPRVRLDQMLDDEES